MIGYIYKTTNLITNKIYIGQRKVSSIKEAEEDKYLGSGVYIKNSILKYRRENFSKEILEIVLDLEELDNKEKYYIAKFNSTDLNIGYNISPGGQGSPYLWQEFASEEKLQEWRNKISENHHDVSGKNNPMYGKTHSKEAREKISKKNTGRVMTEETKEKLRQASLGNEHWKLRGPYTTSEETKKKISEALTGKKRTPEQRKRISESKKGTKLSEKQKESLFAGSRDFGKISLRKKKELFEKRMENQYQEP